MPQPWMSGSSSASATFTTSATSTRSANSTTSPMSGVSEAAFLAAVDALMAADPQFWGLENETDPGASSAQRDAWESARVPDGDVLAESVPGPELAFRLVLADLPAMDEYALVEVVAAWARISAWVQGQGALAAAELASRQLMAIVSDAARARAMATDPARARASESTDAPAPAEPDVPANAPEPADAPAGADASPPDSPPATHRGGPMSVCAHEIAMRLAITRRAAQAMIDMGRAMDGALSPMGDALLAGLIDVPRARVFVDALAGVPLPVALDVQDAVLPRAPMRTAAQVSRDVAAALIAVDPAEASARYGRARQQRRVCHPRTLPDGMAGMYAVLPAADAVALDVALDAAARSARAGGDARTTDQLRADALAASAHQALATGAFGPLVSVHGTNAGNACEQAGPQGAESDDGAGGEAAPGSASEQATANGAEPVDGSTGEAASGEPDAAGSSVANPAGSGGTGSSPPADPFLAELAAPPECELPDVPKDGFRLGRIGGRIARIEVMVPLGVLVGNDEPPPGTLGAEWPSSEPGPGGEDAGDAGAEHGLADQVPGQGPVSGVQGVGSVAVLGRYGPVSPDVARALALGGTWRRLITDPESGVVRDVGRTRYHPPADLAELVRARDRTCVRPGCSVPAGACDLDHTIPHHVDGPTADTNLGPMCTPDHAMKSAGGYRVTQPSAGVFTFHLPSGHTYTRNLDGTTTHDRRDHARRDRQDGHER